MRNLILLFAKYGATIVFVILEIFCFYLIINYNQSQRDIWMHSANLFSGNVNEKVSNFNQFMELRDQNDSLLNENAKLLQKIINYRIFDEDNSFQAFEKSDLLPEYNLIPTRICGKTLNLNNNYFTLCKGSNDGIKPGMGVISDDGIVGIVKNVSDHFSKVLLVLHNQSRISATVKDKDFSGYLVWTNPDPRIHNLESIPRHAEISLGDTILTSGFSTSFPPGIPIGFIENFSPKGASNTYDIDVRLFNDLSNLKSVYTVDYDLFEEKEIIEESADEQ